MDSRPIVAVDARRTAGSGIGRYTQCLIEAFRDSKVLSSRYRLVQLVGKGNPTVSGSVEWNALQLSSWSSGELADILHAADVDVLIAPQYYVPNVATVPVVRILHDAHPFWRDYESPGRRVFEELYGAENLAMLARDVGLKAWGSDHRDVALLIQQMYEIGCEDAAELVTVSQFSANELSSHLPFTAGRWNVAYPFVPSSLNHTGKITLGGPPSILSVSKLEPRKNQLALIEATVGLRRHHPELTLTLVGGPTASFPNYASLVRRAAGNAGDCVSLIEGASDDLLAELYHSCDLFVSCSISEGFGFPGLEALNAGASVLAGGGTSMPEIYGSRARYFDESGLRDNVGSRRYEEAVVMLQGAIEIALFDEYDALNSQNNSSATLPSGIRPSLDSFASSLDIILRRALS